MTPEQKAGVNIHALLQQLRWHVCNLADANIHPCTGFRFAGYLLYTNNMAFGVIEAKKEGTALACKELKKPSLPPRPVYGIARQESHAAFCVGVI